MTNDGDLNVDHLITRLLEVRGCRPGKTVQMSENEIRALCHKSREIFLSQPILLELEAPLKICGKHLCEFDVKLPLNLGDIHGQFNDLLRLFEYGGFPPEANYLFLGKFSILSAFIHFRHFRRLCGSWKAEFRGLFSEL